MPERIRQTASPPPRPYGFPAGALRTPPREGNAPGPRKVRGWTARVKPDAWVGLAGTESGRIRAQDSDSGPRNCVTSTCDSVTHPALPALKSGQVQGEFAKAGQPAFCFFGPPSNYRSRTFSSTSA